MEWQITPYAIAYFCAGLIALGVARAAWRRRAIPYGGVLARVLFAVAEWSLAGALEMAAVGVTAKIFWSVVAYLGTVTGPVWLLLFALEYTHQTRWLTRGKVIAYLIVPLAIFALAATNDAHHLIWTTFTPAPGNLLIYGHGVAFWILVAYSYTLLLIGFGLLVYAVARLRAPYRYQAIILVCGWLAPFVADVIYVFDLSPIPGLDPTPIAFALTGSILALGIFRFRLLDLVPIAREAIIENLRDGILVLDSQDRVVDHNVIAQTLLGAIPLHIGALISAPEIARHIHESLAEIALNETPPRFLELRGSALTDPHQRARGRLIVLRDITRHKQLESTLQEWNARLEHQVAERTEELQTTITRLESEIAERTRVETALRRIEESLAQRVADQSQQLSALYEVILLAGQTLTAPRLHAQLLAKVMDAIGGDAGCLHELDASKTNLRVAAQRALAPESVAQIETLPAARWLADPFPRAVNALAPTEDLAMLRDVRAYLSAPINLQGKSVGLISVFLNRPRLFSVEDIALFSAMGDQIGIILENARLRERAEQSAVQQERRRLARDLHDAVTQSLHSLVLSAETANNRLHLGKLDRLQTSLDQLADGARQALKEMRLLLFELRLASLDQINLLEALQTRLDTVERRAGVQVELNLDDVTPLPKTWETELYCVAMEALNNSLRHARATHLSVRLTKIARGIELEIRDNGKGFDERARNRGGLGLKTMTERAERLGGVLAIEAAPNAGTRVYLRIEEPQ